MDDKDEKVDDKTAQYELHEVTNKLRMLQGDAPLPFKPVYPERSGELEYCSFCGKQKSEVKKLVAGRGVFICDECIIAARKLISEK